LSKVLLLLEICGATGVLLVFLTATSGDRIAESLFTFTDENLLVDLRNDVAVLAVSSPISTYRLRQLLLTLCEGGVRLVQNWSDRPEATDEPTTSKKLHKSGRLHMLDIRLHTMRQYHVF